MQPNTPRRTATPLVPILDGSEDGIVDDIDEGIRTGHAVDEFDEILADLAHDEYLDRDRGIDRDDEDPYDGDDANPYGRV